MDITFDDLGKQIDIKKPNTDRIRVNQHEYIVPPLNQETEIEDIVE